MLKMFGQFPAVLTAAVLGGCQLSSSGDPPCSRQDGRPGCVVESGAYSGYRVGMTMTQAFQVACSNWRPGQSENLYLERGGRRSLKYGASICDFEREALEAEAWTFVEDPEDRRYLSLRFEGQRLAEIVFIPRGGDS